jgi:hypothetical protein
MPTQQYNGQTTFYENILKPRELQPQLTTQLDSLLE